MSRGGTSGCGSRCTWVDIGTASCAIVTVGNTVVVPVAISLTSVVVTVLLVGSHAYMSARVISVVADAKAETSWIDIAVTPQEQEREDWLGEKIENTVEDGFRVWSNDVATLANAPRDWVKLLYRVSKESIRVDDETYDPQESCQGTAVEECSTNVFTNAVRILACFPGENIHNVCQSSHTECEVAPLVAGTNKCAY